MRKSLITISLFLLIILCVSCGKIAKRMEIGKVSKKGNKNMYKKREKLFTWFLTACLVLTQIFLSSTAFAQTYQSKRLSGNDRYKTATAISQEGWPEGSDYVLLARGDDFADALCAGPLAKKYGAPILLTESNELNTDALIELKRLAAKHIIIIGGFGAISYKVENTLKSSGFTDILRLAGDDRYGTSIKIAEKLGTIDKLILATGDNYPDALSISSIASRMGIPILLTQKERLPDSVKRYMDGKKITETYVIGGTGVIDDNVKDSIPNSLRIGGNDRYETNVLVMKEFEDKLDFSNIYAAVGDGPNGDEFADALTGAVLAAQKSSPVVPVYKSLPAITGYYLKSKISIASRIIALGGEAVVPSTTLGSLEACINGIKVSNSYDKPGTYGPLQGTTTISGNVIISAAGVTLQNMVIDGDLLLAESIGNGSIYLKNVTVKGTVSIRCEGSVVTLAGASNNVNIYASRVNISLQNGSISFLNISGAITDSKVYLAGSTHVDAFTSDSSSKVTGQGQITKAYANAPGISFERWPGITYIMEGITSNIAGNDKTGIVTAPVIGRGSHNEPAPDTTPPTVSVDAAVIVVGNDVTTARSTKTGIIYLVLDSANITTKAQAESAVADGTAKKAIVTAANTNIAIPTTGLSPNNYKVVAADNAGNLSAESQGTIVLQNALPENMAPAALNISITGTYIAGETLTGNYDYYDNENDAQGPSELQWYSCDTLDGVYLPVPGARNITFTLTESLLGKYIKFEVTPVALTGTLRGTAVRSAAAGPIQAPVVNTTWEKIYDELLSSYYPGSLDYRIDIKKTADGGYIIAGTSYSNNDDAYLLKIDANGTKQWDSKLGYDTGKAIDRIFSVLQTSDGGYIAAGETMGNNNTMDFYVVKTDGSGIKQWEKAYGSMDYAEQGRSIQQTIDGGYIIAGMKYTDYRKWDFYLVKIDTSGTKLWEQAYDRSDCRCDYGYFVRQTSDSGYIIVGNSHNGVLNQNNIYVVKTDASGIRQWDYMYGNNDGNAAFDAVETGDGYIITGYSHSTVSGHLSDLCLIKLDKNGLNKWVKKYGNNSENCGLGMTKTADGYIIVGMTAADMSQIYLMKTDTDCNKVWEKTVSGVSDYRGHTVLQTDDGFIIAGYAKILGGKIIVIKTDSYGNVIHPR